MKNILIKSITIILIFNLIFIIFSNISLVKAKSTPVTETTKVATTIDDIISQGDGFLNEGKESPINDTNMKNLSNIIYNTLLAIGMVVAVIIGLILGIKFLMSTIDEKVKIKEKLIAYFIGCIVLFGAFGIWKIIITIMENI